MTDANFIIVLFVTKGLIRGPKTTKNCKNTAWCKSGMSQNSRNVYFLETKSPCGVAPNTEEGLRIYPNKINSFIQKSGKVGFPQKSRIWWKFTYQNSLFTENLNGPYGPYEPLLWDISRNKWPKNWVFDENSLFQKMTMSKKIWKWTFWPEKKPCGVPRQQNKGCKHIPEYSRPKLYKNICVFI